MNIFILGVGCSTMSVLLSTNYRTHNKSFSFDSAQIFNQMFSRRKSLTSSSPKSSITQATPLESSSVKEDDRRRSASDIPISKPIFGRRKSDDAGTKRFLFRKRSKDQQIDQASPQISEKKEQQKLQKLTLEDAQPILKSSKPIACKTHSEPYSAHTSILELSESPKRVSQLKNHDRRYSDAHGRLSVTPPPGSADEEFMYKCPSSPLLVAVRTAVDSLSQYNDFDILEKIGSGFYAEVFKVRYINTTYCLMALLALCFPRLDTCSVCECMYMPVYCVCDICNLSIEFAANKLIQLISIPTA